MRSVREFECSIDYMDVADLANQNKVEVEAQPWSRPQGRGLHFEGWTSQTQDRRTAYIETWKRNA
jgi:hypothetical protein